MKQSQTFALAGVLALLVGCGGGAALQTEAEEDLIAEEVLVSDLAAERAAAEAAAAEALERAAAEAAALEAQAAAQAQALRDQAAAALPEIRTIYFDFDQATIRSEFHSVLNAHARYLQANPRARVLLQGHTDERGTREYNMALGERRGTAVQRYLAAQGVAASQMEVVSYGEERPVVRAARTQEDHARNRRVELNYR